MAHTPGPWKIGQPLIYTDGRPSLWYGDETPPFQIYQDMEYTQAMKWDGMVVGFTDYEAAGVVRMEDARLIAVAPEMLAALQGMMHHHDHDQEGWPQSKCGRCQVAFTVITKAIN